jgi:hypothetical protein
MATGFEIPSLRFALEAAGVVNRRRFVMADSNGKGAQATAGVSVIGVSMNSTKAGETLEIADGIVIVEAGAAITPNAIVQSDANGKAITMTTGTPVGTALSGASAAGEMVAVKTPTSGAAAVTVESGKYTVTYQVEDLAAGADIADMPIYVVPVGYTFEVEAAQVIMQGTTAGVDDANTAVVAVEVGATALVSKTYNTANQPPASGAAGSLGVIANGERAAGDVITFSVTNGATADLPAFMLQITGTLAAV